MGSRRTFIENACLLAGGVTLPFSQLFAKTTEGKPFIKDNRNIDSNENGNDNSAISKFIEAIRKGNRSKVERLLSSDAQLLYARTNQDISMFSWAYFNRQEEIAKLLLSKNYTEDLFDYAAAGNPDKIREAFKNRPELAFMTNRFGYSLLHYGALAGQISSVDSLIGGPSVSPNLISNDENQTPALLFMIENPDEAKAYQMTFTCLSNGANPNLTDKNKTSLLHKAAEMGYKKIIELLIRKGADINAKDSNGNTPLAIAKSKNQNTAISLLEKSNSIKKDKYITRIRNDKSGNSPISKNDLGIPQIWVDKFVGIAHFDVDEARKMIKKCPDLVYCRSTWDELPVEGCGHIGTAPIMNVLLDAGSPYSICTAASIGDFAKVKELIKENPELVHERGPHDLPLFFYTAVTNGSPLELAWLLLNSGADINAGASGRTALHHATALGRLKLMEFLLEKGADQDIVCTSPFLYGTPLDNAKNFKMDKAIDLLKKYQAKK